MKKEYDTFIEKKGDLQEGGEIVIAIRDLEKYAHRAVRCIVSHSSEELPDGDVLWIRYGESGAKEPAPWAIKITEKMGDLFGKNINC